MGLLDRWDRSNQEAFDKSRATGDWDIPFRKTRGFHWPADLILLIGGIPAVYLHNLWLFTLTIIVWLGPPYWRSFRRLIRRHRD